MTARTLAGVTLARGSHSTPADGLCMVEAAAWVAGEPHTDHPDCVCPIIAAFCRAWNDALPTDGDRDRVLLPLVDRIVGTRSTPAVEARRAMLALDWHIRVSTPAWLRLVPALTGHADALAALPPITDLATASAARPHTEKAAAAAWAAGAAGSAWEAWAAWAAARAAEAAWAAWAAEAAAGSAEAAAGSAVAAWAAGAAGSAGGAGASWAALAPTVRELQASAVDLLDRMIEVTA